MNTIDLETKIKATLEQVLPHGHQNICFELKDDVVTLNGMVSCESDRRALDDAITKVEGISVIRDYITIGNETASARLKNAILQSLHNKVEVPAERIRLCVTPKTIEVRGTVKWNYQKKATLDIVSSFKEDREISDFLIVDPNISTAPVKEEILRVLRTDLRLKADDINIIVNGYHVILVGSVPDENQKMIAEKIILDLPSIRSVRNELYIS